MTSAQTNAATVQDDLTKERSTGRLINPITAAGLHKARFRVYPSKGCTPGKWRLVTNLSFPPRYSVNDGIDPGPCSMFYITVNSVARTVASLNSGALMANVDIKATYRLIPVHPDNCPMQWRVKTICEGGLSFGL